LLVMPEKGGDLMHHFGTTSHTNALATARSDLIAAAEALGKQAAQPDSAAFAAAATELLAAIAAVYRAGERLSRVRR
jgi:hypothetical protein